MSQICSNLETLSGVYLAISCSKLQNSRESHDKVQRNTRRSSSKLPALVDLILARPIASAGMIAAELGVTPRAAQAMVAELGLREITGRGRYRAWGIL
jgi:hypothetical protein